jgi:uncharacterized protein with PhoU and TrkA domain
VGALAVLWLIINTAVFEGLVDRSIKFALRRTGVLKRALDHEIILRLHAGFAVAEIAVEAGSSLAGRKLAEAALHERGLVVLGLTRDDGNYVAAPGADTVCRPSDVLTVYGRDTEVRAFVAAAADSSNESTAAVP